MKKIFLIASLAAMFACGSKESNMETLLLPKASFDTTMENQEVSLYTIKNGDIAAQITNFGARLVTLIVPSNDGFKDVVWGYESISDYINATDQYSGPIVGRFGNRINKGKFTLDSIEYQTTINNGENHLHGGVGGFSTKIWSANQLNDSTVVMSYMSADKEEGYPGNLNISVTYTVTSNCALKLEYKATSDAKTIVNPTSHAYFNLNGTADDAMEHILTIRANSFTPTDSGLIPTGEIRAVENTPLDFRNPTAIGKRINENYEPLTFGKGYDHNWIFTNNGLNNEQVVLYSKKSGIKMTMFTDQPAVQFYSGNFMDGKDRGKRGDMHNFRTSVALEAQNYPDAPNHSNFPSAVLNVGEKYTQTTIYKFNVE